MTKLFEYILIALACPLVLPIIDPQENEEEGMTRKRTYGAVNYVKNAPTIIEADSRKER